MTQIASEVPVRQLRIQFFEYLFGDHQSGHLCIAVADKSKSAFKQRFFEWPAQKVVIANYIEEVASDNNVWFCVNLLKGLERKKDFTEASSFAWADLDEVSPENVTPAPTCVVESSIGRYQAYWRIAGNPVPPDVAEDYSRRITYANGADKSGWDLTQLLRVPWTKNFKYSPPQTVKLLAVLPTAYDAVELDKLTPVSELDSEAGGSIPADVPEFDKLPTPDQILYKFKATGSLDEEFANLYTKTPPETADWSRLLWRFLNKCLDMGMTKEEVFSVSQKAACNKYERDNRPITYLWRDVSKAAQEHDNYKLLVSSKTVIPTMPHLVDFDEFEEDTFIKDYKEWASSATDAPEQYHELTCFVALSAIVCSGLWLAVDWGEIVPNIWGLILGESTLTRKTTAMRLAVDIIKDIDDNLILATDGSAEGLLTGLSHRPKRVSIFWKDEVSGLFDSINRKDYLAGLPETLTQLYDVPKVLTRLLRKETVTISEPYFIFFGGGIRDKVYSLLNDEYILSGFLPRFLVVSGENDLGRLRRTGPPSIISTERKDHIIRTLTDLRERYNPHVTISVAGQEIEMPSRIEARLTDNAWNTFQQFEEILTNAGNESDMQMLALPVFTRLAFSLLKMSLLVAASRREPNESMRLEVTEADVKQAGFYIEKWGHYSIDLLMNAGQSNSERILERALSMIKRNNGLTKAVLMQRLHLNAREAKDLIDTLLQRGLIDVKPAGRGVRLYIL